MSFKIGDRVKTTEKTMGLSHTQYHNVTGTITNIRSNSSIPIMFKPDKNVVGEVDEWALFEDEVEAIPDYDYWKKKYWALRAKVDSFRYDIEGM
jgi:hypothetical protein